MKLFDLEQKLAEIGKVQILKEGVVLTVLITGDELSKAQNLISFQNAVLSYAEKKFPTIEALRNEDGFICMVCKR